MYSIPWFTKSRDYKRLPDDELNGRTEAVYTRIRECVSNGEAKDSKARNQLAQLATLIPDVQSTKSAELVNAAEVAVAALTSPSPDPGFAETLILDIEERVVSLLHPVQAYFQIMAGPVRLVLLGLSCFVSVLILLRVEISDGITWLARQQLQDVNVGTLQAIIVAGAIGATLSLVIRLAKFQQKSSGVRGVSLFLTGFFKPVIGTVFAIFVCGMIKSEILPIEVDAEKSDEFLISLAFLAGFSERFARDIIARAQLR